MKFKQTSKFILYSFLIISNINLINTINKEQDKQQKNTDKTYIKEYDDSNYLEEIKIDKPLLLYIYSKNCKKCDQKLTYFIQAQIYSKKKKFDLTFVKINGQENPIFTEDFKISTYPFIVYIDKEKNRIEYDDIITKYNLIRFINIKINHKLHFIEELKDIGRIVNDTRYKKDQVFLLSTLMMQGINNTFNKYRTENDKLIYIYCRSIECYNEFNEDLVIYRHFDEPQLNFSNVFTTDILDLDMDYLRKFVHRHLTEAGGYLTDEYFFTAKQYKKGMLIYFRDEDNLEHKKLDSLIKELGKNARKKNIYTFIADIKGQENFEEYQDYFAILPEELPMFLYIDNINTRDLSKCKTYRKIKVNNEIKMENDIEDNIDLILKFINRAKKGKIKKDLRSQLPINNPMNYNEVPYKIIVGKNYESEVIKNNKNVLVAFVNGNVKTDLDDKYLDVVEKLKKEIKNVVFTVIDGSRNEARDIDFKEKDLPFIYLYTTIGGKKRNKNKFKPENKNDINEEELKKFIKSEIHEEENSDL